MTKYQAIALFALSATTLGEWMMTKSAVNAALALLGACFVGLLGAMI